MADSKLTGLSAITELTTGDLLYAVDDVAGTPTSKKITADNVFASLSKQAAYASRPAAGITGRIYFPTDSFYLERDDGAAWDPSGPIFPMTPPVDGDFAWVNQGTATVSTTNGGVFLSVPSGAGNGMRIRKKAAPGVPYVITAAFLPLFPAAASTPFTGLCFRQASDGKLHIFALYAAGTTLHIWSAKYTNETTFSATYTDTSVNAAAAFGGAVWLRIADNNTNRICSFSVDGQNWVAFHTVGRTDFITADEVGYFADINSGGTCANLLLSWKET